MQFVLDRINRINGISEVSSNGVKTPFWTTKSAQADFRRAGACPLPMSQRTQQASALRKFVLALSVALLILFTMIGAVAEPAQKERPAKMIGMYVHQHWPYNRPYAARTWTLEDWRGYADGLSKLGFNTILIWPMLETMPDPLTPSDRAALEKIGKVIDLLHTEFGMRVYLCVCPNIVANNAEASKATFEKRHYYYCDTLVNPADPVALDKLVRWREQLLRPLAKADGISIIDSDPGCYPGSTTADFVRLLGEHRKMLDRLRPGIELIYWMHAGWRGWNRFYETGKLVLGTPEEQLDALTQFKALNAEPWGLANGLAYAEKLGVADRVISFNYGRIEGEPSFPMTNFGGDLAYEGGKGDKTRGVMGNAQTHCVQLPNTFAFARGATGRSLTHADYIQFADDLIPGQGALIVQAWQALAGHEANTMRTLADTLAGLPEEKLTAGRLKGLLFGSPKRFIGDLTKMLRLRAALEDFDAATQSGQKVKETLKALIQAAEVWQKQHGFQNNWYDPKLHTALRKLNDPAVNTVLNITYEAKEPFDPGITTPADQVKANFRKIETYTTQLLDAMRAALKRIS